MRRRYWQQFLGCTLLVLAGAACAALAQNASPNLNKPSVQAEQPATLVGLSSVANTPQRSLVKADAASKQSIAKPASVTKPEWSELTPAQHTALKPLAANWSGLSEGHKRKWISLAQSYPKMSVADQARLHTRMSEWAALSTKQREQARLNFAHTQELTKTLSPEERKAKWQAYQALSAEEKQKLAAKAPPKPVGAAVAAKPAKPAVKMASSSSGQDPSSGKISIAPHLLGQNSLMPQSAKP